MKLAIFNGSPRKTKSNSTILIEKFSNGYHSLASDPITIEYLAQQVGSPEHIEKFIEAEAVIIIFPLYTDAMPGQVKYFLEKIDPIDTKNKKVGFIVQSGFPEAHHSQFVKRYLDKFALRKEWDYLGTIIKGGVEGIQVMTPAMNKKLFTRFENLGKVFAEKGVFDPKITKELATPYRLDFFTRLVYRIMIGAGLTNYYWNMKLKENNAFDKRFAQPYLPR